MNQNVKLSLSFLVAVLLVLGRLFIWDIYIVDGASMCPSLNQFDSECVQGKKQVLLVNKLSKSYERYDIVVFQHPELPEKLIKRIMAFTDETVVVQNNNAFLKDKNTFISMKYNSIDAEFDFSSAFNLYTVPEDYLFLLGDNRSISIDSRNCFNYDTKQCYRLQSNYLSNEQVIGKAIFSLFPFRKL